MPIGILQKEKATVIEVTESGSSVIVDKSYIAESDIDCKNAIVGLPLDNFIIKNVYLPNISKKELQKAIELQLEFNIPNHQTKYDTSYITKELRSGYLLLMVASKKTELNEKAKATVPAPLGLYSFAIHHDLINKKENTLLIYINEENITSITVKGTEVVFMREYPLNIIKNIMQRIQLSSQAVYLQPDRRFIDIKKIIVLSTDEKNKTLIAKAVGQEKKVQWVDSSEYDNKETGNLLLTAGLALFHNQYKAMSGWSISKKPPGKRESIKKILIFAIPILIIFLPLYYYAGYYAKSSNIKSIQTEINQISGQLGNFNKLGGQASKEKVYMKKIGNPILNFYRVNELFNIINSCRSNNLWLTSLSGRIDGMIVISGFAKSYSEITSFIKNLEASKFIKDSNLNYSNEASSQNVNFQMTFKLTKGYSFILEKKSSKKPMTKVNNDEKPAKTTPTNIKPIPPVNATNQTEKTTLTNTDTKPAVNSMTKTNTETAKTSATGSNTQSNNLKPEPRTNKKATE